jgi:hypothetical protein
MGAYAALILVVRGSHARKLFPGYLGFEEDPLGARACQSNAITPSLIPQQQGARHVDGTTSEGESGYDIVAGLGLSERSCEADHAEEFEGVAALHQRWLAPLMRHSFALGRVRVPLARLSNSAIAAARRALLSASNTTIRLHMPSFENAMLYSSSTLSRSRTSLMSTGSKAALKRATIVPARVLIGGLIKRRLCIRTRLIPHGATVLRSSQSINGALEQHLQVDRQL